LLATVTRGAVLAIQRPSSWVSRFYVDRNKETNFWLATTR